MTKNSKTVNVSVLDKPRKDLTAADKRKILAMDKKLLAQIKKEIPLHKSYMYTDAMYRFPELSAREALRASNALDAVEAQRKNVVKGLWKDNPVKTEKHDGYLHIWVNQYALCAMVDCAGEFGIVSDRYRLEFLRLVKDDLILKMAYSGPDTTKFTTADESTFMFAASREYNARGGKQAESFGGPARAIKALIKYGIKNVKEVK